ncbi:uncharacterized protein LOC121736087 [Aricia agestis]|uniref:uncharacterized protein LOC121736087 n=1 Tax=Aricia agestis TaxID=91739 RepID=UPI001C206C28|nr:uncharacterized protein LOC121736087 [Aricia agestis]
MRFCGNRFTYFSYNQTNMSSFAFLCLCAQLLLVQNVYSQCVGGGAAGYGLGPGFGPGLGAYGAAVAPGLGLAGPGLALAGPGLEYAAAYGGAGVGDVAVAGEMPVAGTTLVAGQVPILGAVRFAGDLPAAGVVTITGSCACGCGAPGPYYYYIFESIRTLILESITNKHKILNMFAKIILFCFAQALLVQNLSAQCIGAYEAIGAPWAGAYAAGPWVASPAAVEYSSFAPLNLAASSGGGLAVSSASPIAPTGVFVKSENAYDGAVLVSGQLPFLSTVALEGPLPSVGAGAIAYGCGNGNIAILSEDIAPVGYGPSAGPFGYGPSIAGPVGLAGPLSSGLGYGAGPISYGGWGAGCGCGALF